MIETNLGINGAKRSSYKPLNLNELALHVAGKNPNVTDRDQLRDLLILAVKQHEQSEGYIDACVEWACSNAVNNLTRARTPQKISREAKIKIEDSVKAMNHIVKKEITRRAQQMILDITMPNGKAMRDVTGTYLAKVNIGYAKIAKAAGSKRIGAVISEAEARKLMR